MGASPTFFVTGEPPKAERRDVAIGQKILWWNK